MLFEEGHIGLLNDTLPASGRVSLCWIRSSPSWAIGHAGISALIAPVVAIFSMLCTKQ